MGSPGRRYLESRRQFHSAAATAVDRTRLRDVMADLYKGLDANQRRALALLITYQDRARAARSA